MKLAQTFTRLATAFVLAVGFATLTPHTQAAAAPGMQSIKAKVKQVTGNATYSSGGAAQKLTEGLELPEGSVVTTGPSATVILDLGPSGFVSVKPESTLSLDKLQVRAAGNDTVVETKLEVKKGSILGHVKKLSSASKYDVQNEKGVAGIRGTSYHIFAVGIFRCSDGTLVVRIFNPATLQTVQTFNVTAGRECDASAAVPAVAVLTSAIARELRQETSDISKANLGRNTGLVTAEGTPDQIREAVVKALERQQLTATQATSDKQKTKQELEIEEAIRELASRGYANPTATQIKDFLRMPEDFMSMTHPQ